MKRMGRGINQVGFEDAFPDGIRKSSGAALVFSTLSFFFLVMGFKLWLFGCTLSDIA